MTVEIVAAAAARVSGLLLHRRGTVINGVQRGVVIWQILRKFTAAVTTLGRYLSSVARCYLNGKSPSILL